MKTRTYSANYTDPTAPAYSDVISLGDKVPGTDSRIASITRQGQPASQFTWGETSRADRITVKLDNGEMLALQTYGYD